MTKTTLTDGSPVTPDHREIDPATGMQKGYVVLSAEERAKGFVEPVRQSYVHQKCGAVTTMGLTLAETYARQPEFYSGTFCATCRDHFPVGPDGEFVWDKTSQKVGTRQADQPFEGTDDRTIADCVSRFPGNRILERGETVAARLEMIERRILAIEARIGAAETLTVKDERE